MTFRRFINELHELQGFQYGARIFLGTCGLWFLSRIFDIDPLWAVISLIIVTEIGMEPTWQGFKSRIINTLVGCLTGLTCLLAMKPSALLLPIALTAAVCVSAYLIRIPYGWRIAAITAAIVVLPALAERSSSLGITIAFERTFEVFLGSTMALCVTGLFHTAKAVTAFTKSRFQHVFR